MAPDQESFSQDSDLGSLSPKSLCKRERVYSGSQFRNTVHHGGEVRVIGS